MQDALTKGVLTGGVLILFAVILLVFMRGRRPDPDIDQD